MNAVAWSTQLPLALIGDIGGGELLLVLAAALMLFGGKRIPSIARTLGRTAEDLRRAAQDFREQLLNADRELGQPFDDPSPAVDIRERPEVPAVPVPARTADSTGTAASTKADDALAGPCSGAAGTGTPAPSMETDSRDLAG